MYYQLITTTSKFPSTSVELRAFATEEELKQSQTFAVVNPITIRPNSVYVAAIGCHWTPGAWQKVVDMVQYTGEHGICCWLVEFPDLCVTMPYDAIGNLRDSACLAALDAGFEWVLLIDNDVLPEPDMLVKLVNWGMPITVPLMIDHERNVTSSGPNYPVNSGLRRIKWSALSCVLIWTKVLNCFPNGTLFTSLQVEYEFFNKLLHYGHRAYIDTNTELKLASPPGYNGGLDTLSEKWAFMDKADRRRKEKPDRRPIDLEDGREVYLPIVLIEQPETSENTETPQVETKTDIAAADVKENQNDNTG